MMCAEPVYSLRPAEKSDVPAMYQLLMDMAEADGSVSTTTIQDVKNLFDNPGLHPPADSMLAITPSGDLLGAAWVVGTPQTSIVMELWCNIHPTFRNQPQGRALEEWLLTWAERRASRRLADVPATPESQPLLATISWEDLPERNHLLDEHGFIPVRYFHHMHRDLRKPVEFIPLPAGFQLTCYQPEVDEALRNAYNETFEKDWNFRFMDAENWQREIVDRPDFRPELCFIVREGPEIAAFSLNHVHASDGEQEAYITHIGTRPAWRRRGIASALLSACLRAFREADIPSAALGVDTDNPNKALSLYHTMGFETLRTLVQYVRYADR